jgi:small nuclear ribonucleoprotein (snRNP)-like protein
MSILTNVGLLEFRLQNYDILMNAVHFTGSMQQYGMPVPFSYSRKNEKEKLLKQILLRKRNH